MDWLDSETVKVVLTVIVVPLAGWAWRQWKAVSATRKTAIKTVESWESTVNNKNHQIEEWERRYTVLHEDYTRSREIIQDQNSRLTRKDERIAHLERLCDAKGQHL